MPSCNAMLKLSRHRSTFPKVNGLRPLHKSRFFHAGLARRNEHSTKSSTDPKHDGTEISDREWEIRSGRVCTYVTDNSN